MAQLREIKQRIKGVQSIRQISTAIKTVAAARLKRAQHRILMARPYAYAIAAVMKNLAVRLGGEVHPLLSHRKQGKTALLVVTSDRGLCGSFNSNVVRRARTFLKDHPGTEVWVIGKRGRDFLKRLKAPLRKEWLGIFPHITRESIDQICDEIEGVFAGEKFKTVLVVYNGFKSAVQQEVILETLLPIRLSELPSSDWQPYQGGDYGFEPDLDALVDNLVVRYLGTQIQRILLESFASEMGARRNAMEAASKNAGEMIGKLTLEFNRARQAAITKELAEIVGGAAALE